MRAALVLLALLNVVDGLLTTWALSHHVAVEINPVMAAAMALGTGVFLVAKALLVGAGAAALLHAAKTKPVTARRAAWACVAVYGVLAVYEIVEWSLNS